jgi:hypothetical protein
VFCVLCVQAGIIAHKKEAAAAGLREMREELNKTNQELEQKREIVSSVEGAEVLKGEDVGVFILVKVKVNVKVKTTLFISKSNLKKLLNSLQCCR